MKKLFLLSIFLSASNFEAQNNRNLHIQNYTNYQIHFVTGKMNWNTCTKSSISYTANGGMYILGPSPDPGNVPADAFYQYILNTSNTFNPNFPATPLIDRWVKDGNYNPNATTGLVGMPAQSTNPLDPAIPLTYSTNADWAFMKYGIADLNGNPYEGYYSFHVANTPCYPNVTTPSNVPFGSTMISNNFLANSALIGNDLFMIIDNQ